MKSRFYDAYFLEFEMRRFPWHVCDWILEALGTI